MGCERNGQQTAAQRQAEASCVPLIKANRRQLPGITQGMLNNHIASNYNNISNTLAGELPSILADGFTAHSIF